MLGTFHSSHKTCLEGEEVLLRTVTTVTEEKVSSSGKGDDVVAVRH